MKDELFNIDLFTSDINNGIPRNGDDVPRFEKL